ncbi:DUF6268 family outer membrane beta-barrel protein [Nafulsella turpanensis]|uniref:DUF6268 family outer membrane beta-barrel protein n=1 Tax=Nafulsella turpanensis TaxID=1265690 RepID=UPI0004763017|nr:DUF6268 family outer membrane beta-barrel protein [Nafulsella turpanensis]
MSMFPVGRLKGQTVPSAEDIQQEWVSPSVEGDRRSKGIQISYNQISPFGIHSTPIVPGINEAEARVQKLEEIEFSLRLPILWKGRTTIAAGVSYLYEEYNFINPSALTYDFYTNLQNKHLNSLDAKVFVVYALNGRAFIGSRIGLELNGDYEGNELPFRQQAKGSVAAVYGWKTNPYTMYGLGAYYSYTLGRPSIYPVFIWNETFNDRWGVEAVLPQSFRLRRNFSEETILLLGAKVLGRSYHIISDEPPLGKYPNLELRNSNIYAFLEFEQEIYDFLWFGLTGGYRYNINFNISEENSFSNSRIIENEVGHSPYFNVSLFVVPPQAWVEE